MIHKTRHLDLLWSEVLDFTLFLCHSPGTVHAAQMLPEKGQVRRIGFDIVFELSLSLECAGVFAAGHCHNGAAELEPGAALLL